MTPTNGDRPARQRKSASKPTNEDDEEDEEDEDSEEDEEGEEFNEFGDPADWFLDVSFFCLLLSSSGKQLQEIRLYAHSQLIAAFE